MINANELKRGNIINIESKYKRYNELFVEVESINSTEINTDFRPYELNHCIGIPLTEEILIKCGFELLEETILTGLGRSETTYEKDNFRFYLLKPEKYNALVFCLGNDVINDKIQYLHQLQNLYFALTNEELTIQL